MPVEPTAGVRLGAEHSSGALLALHAAAAGLPIARLALLEPPIETDGAGRSAQAAITGSLSPSSHHPGGTAMGVPDQLAAGFLRLSFGPETSDSDIHGFLSAFETIITRHAAAQAA